MKKYISLALIWSFCLLAFSACESYLEEMPQNKLMPTTTDDYDQLLNNAYITERVMPTRSAILLATRIPSSPFSSSKM